LKNALRNGNLLLTSTASEEFPEMVARIVAFCLWATCVWVGVATIGVDVETVGNFVADVGCVVVSVAGLTLVFQGWLRKSNGIITGYAVALLGRTLVPLITTAVALFCCEECFRREAAIRVLIGYFGSAPVHVWASIPCEKEIVENAKFQNASSNRNEAGSRENQVR